MAIKTNNIKVVLEENNEQLQKQKENIEQELKEIINNKDEDI